MPLYQAIDVWRRTTPTRIVRYQCFKNVSSGRYTVQSADFYHLPYDQEKAAELELQFVELFAEQTPDDQAGSFESIEAAIQAHDPTSALTKLSGHELPPYTMLSPT